MRKRPPSRGSFIAWKKGRMDIMGRPEILPVRQTLIKLLVPASAKRVMASRTRGANTTKLRVSEAKVLEIRLVVRGKVTKVQHVNCLNLFNASPKRRITYRVGRTVRPRRPFDPDKTEVCASGIHCFMDPKDAVRYKA